MVTEGPRLKSRREVAGVKVSEAVEQGDQQWWARVRSALLLGALLTGLGVAVAAVIGLVALAMAALVDQALG